MHDLETARWHMVENQISQEKNDSAAENIPDEVQYYIQNITSSLHRSVEGIFETAKWCAEADKKFENMFGSRQILLAHLPFSEAYFSKLVNLHNDPKFRNPEVRKLLPPSFSTIDELRRLTTPQLDRATRDGLITPELKRADVMKLFGRQQRTESEYANMELFAGIYMPKDYGDDEIAKLKNDIEALVGDTPVSIKHVYMNKELKKEVTIWKNQPRLALKEARRLLRHAKASHKRYKPNKSWTYSKDETDLNKHMTIKEMMAVMTLVDCDDQFEKYLRSHDIEVPPHDS